MENAELRKKIENRFPASAWQTQVPSGVWTLVAERFAVVYHLYSMKHGHRLRVKAFIPETSAAIDSVAGIYPAADWAERETYDQYGIRFTGHPDLRRILNPDDFTGHPLRKDFPVEGIGYRDQFEKIVRTRAQ